MPSENILKFFLLNICVNISLNFSMWFGSLVYNYDKYIVVYPSYIVNNFITYDHVDSYHPNVPAR